MEEYYTLDQVLDRDNAAKVELPNGTLVDLDDFKKEEVLWSDLYDSKKLKEKKIERKRIVVTVKKTGNLSHRQREKEGFC